MSPKLSEVELLLNKAALHQARLREALGFKHEVVDDAELRRQEEALFKCEPEFAGVGYRAKDDPTAELKRKAASSDDKLRRQMLGKNSKSTGATKVTPKGQSKASSTLQRSDSDDDDEEGRNSTFTSKRRKVITEINSSATPASHSYVSRDEPDAIRNGQQSLPTTSNEGRLEESAQARLELSMTAKPQKRAAQSYLDELLAQKAKKRKKHKKKQGGIDGDWKS